jgi:hypothetical protein
MKIIKTEDNNRKNEYMRISKELSESKTPQQGRVLNADLAILTCR